MEVIDAQTQVSYRGNHSIAEVLTPQEHRPFLAKVAPLRVDCDSRGCALIPAGGEDSNDLSICGSMSSLNRPAGCRLSPRSQASHGLSLLSLAMATERRRTPSDTTAGKTSQRDEDARHAAADNEAASRLTPTAALRGKVLKRDYDDEIGIIDSPQQQGKSSECKRQRRGDASFHEKMSYGEDTDNANAMKARSEKKQNKTVGSWPPARGYITAQTAMERFSQIRNHNQLKSLDRIKVRRPAMGRASGCDLYVYDERKVAQLAAKLESQQSDRVMSWFPPMGRLTMKMAMERYPQIRHRDQLKRLPRHIVRRPTVGRAAACNVVVFDAGDVEQLVRELKRASPQKREQTSWQPPAGFMTLQMALDTYPHIKNRRQLATISGTIKVRRPAMAHASGCNITVYPGNAVAEVAANLLAEADESSTTTVAQWRPPNGKLTTKMAMEKYPQIRHHDQLRNLPKTKVRRPTMGRYAACSITVYADTDLAELAREANQRRRQTMATAELEYVAPLDARGTHFESWLPPNGKLTASEAMKRYPQIRNHTQLRHLSRTKVHRPALGRASGCNMWVYDDCDIRELAQSLGAWDDDTHSRIQVDQEGDVNDEIAQVKIKSVEASDDDSRVSRRRYQDSVPDDDLTDENVQNSNDLPQETRAGDYSANDELQTREAMQLDYDGDRSLATSALLCSGSNSSAIVSSETARQRADKLTGSHFAGVSMPDEDASLPVYLGPDERSSDLLPISSGQTLSHT